MMLFKNVRNNYLSLSLSLFSITQTQTHKQAKVAPAPYPETRPSLSRNVKERHLICVLEKDFPSGSMVVVQTPDKEKLVTVIPRDMKSGESIIVKPPKTSRQSRNKVYEPKKIENKPKRKSSEYVFREESSSSSIHKTKPHFRTYCDRLKTVEPVLKSSPRPIRKMRVRSRDAELMAKRFKRDINKISSSFGRSECNISTYTLTLVQ